MSCTAGPSHTNGWDDPVEGWEYQPAYLGPYPETNNGKTLVDDTLSDAGWEKVVKVRGKGSSVERRDGGPPNAGRGSGKSWASTQERSRRNGGGGGGGRGGGQDGNGRKFNNGRGGGGGGSTLAPRAQAWGPNARGHPEVANAKHPAQTVHGGLKTTNSWDSGNSQGPPAMFADNGWQNVGEYRNNGSETSSRSGPGWHQGARAASERSSSSGGNPTLSMAKMWNLNYYLLVLFGNFGMVKHKGVDAVAVPKVQNMQLLTAACRADVAGMALAIDLYVGVH